MSESMTYVARAACGCLKMAMVDNPERKRDTANAVAQAIRLGETVERIPTAQVREMDWTCEAHKKKKEAVGP